ncbi:Prohibitin-1, mitochondrial, partial [Cucurbita argyrosperma subsp. sororia]
MISRLFWLKRAVTTVGVGLVSVLSASVYTVREGERAVIFDRFQGRINEKTVGEGKHFLLPWVQQAFIVDITTQPQELTFQCRTKHFQPVTVTVRTLSRPDITQLSSMVSSLGNNHADEVIKSILLEVLNYVISKSTAENFSIDLPVISSSIREILSKRAKQFGVVLEDFCITSFKFSREFSDSVERKQVAFQDYETAKIWTLIAEQQVKIGLIWADAEAKRSNHQNGGRGQF